MEELITYLGSAMVDHPDDVNVTKIDGEDEDLYELRVNPDETGKVIGRQGRTARALRAIVRAASAKTGRPARVEIVD